MKRIDLFGVVGEDFSPTTVRASLPSSGEDVTVSINSGGGVAVDGSAIYNLLAQHRGTVAVEVIGIAASAASLIAMAGDTITMFDGSIMMIHDPLQVTVGNSDDHSKTIEQLEAHALAYAKVYAKRAGISEQTARAAMKAELWFTADEAVAAGFATATSSQPARAFASYDQRHHGSVKAALARASASGRKAPRPDPAWKTVVAKINRSSGLGDQPKAEPGSGLTGWAKSVARFNARQR